MPKWLTPIFEGGFRYWSGLEVVTLLLPASFSEEYRGAEEDIPLHERLIVARCQKPQMLARLRWLPKKCRVEFVGAVQESLQTAIQEHEQYRWAQDDVALHHLSVLRFPIISGSNEENVLMVHILTSYNRHQYCALILCYEH